MKNALSLIFIVLTSMVFSQSNLDSLAQVLSKDICDCAGKIDGTKPDKINESGIYCTNSVLLTHLDSSFFRPTTKEGQGNYNTLMQKLGELMNSCERIIYLQRIAGNLPAPLKNVPKEFFLDQEFLQYFELTSNQESSKEGMLVYDGPKNKERIQRFIDIRYLFNSNADALTYYRAKVNELSEGGKEIEISQKISGIQELKLFEESDKMRKMLDEMQLDGKQYYVLFVRKNVLVKLFFGTPKKYSTINLVPFIQKARDLIK